MTGTFQSAKRPTSGKIDQDRARPAATHVAATLNAAPPVRGLIATAQMLGRRGGVQPAGGVVQAKLFRGRTEIEAPKDEGGASEIVRSLIGAEQEYVLRSDEALTAETVHVLHRESKYLLGERHDQSDWPERTQHWDVDTMLESGKAFPEKPSVVGDEEATQQGQPLESIHAYLLAVLLEVQSWLGSWRTAWQTALSEDVPGNSEEEDRLLEEELRKMGLEGDSEQQISSEGATHEGTVETHEDLPLDLGDENPLFDESPDTIENALQTSGIAAGELLRQYTELKVVMQQYINLAKIDKTPSPLRTFTLKMSISFNPIKETMALVQKMMALPPTTTRGEARQLFDEISTGPVRLFVGAVQGLIGETPAGANPDRIAAVADGAPFEAGQNGLSESLALTDPYREAAMIRNIDAARAPLLVRIGNNHVDRVGDAVPGSVKVKIGTDFAAMTKKP